jgi:hypothetical protein
MKRTLALLAAVLVAACASPPPRPTSVDPAITGEVDRAITGPGPRPPQAPSDALLPPLRMELPAWPASPWTRGSICP